MSRKDVNSVKAEMLIPSQAEGMSPQACVETMRVLPYPANRQKGKDIVRTVGKRTDRGGRNDHPLAFPNTMYDKLVPKVTASHDIYSELTAGVGTYPVPDGLTRDTFTNGFRGKIGGAEVYEDGNLTVDSSSDAKGGVFAGGKNGGIVLVQGRAPWQTTRDEPSYGGGGKSIWLWDEQTTRPLAA